MWKLNTKSVPGSSQPVAIETTPSNQAQASTMRTTGSPKKLKSKSQNDFLNYESKTSDAWDLSDTPGNEVPLSLPDVKSSALKVIHSHQQKMKQASSSDPNFKRSTPTAAGDFSQISASRHYEAQSPDKEQERLKRFGQILSSPSTTLEQLRELSWKGIPTAFRPIIWRILSGYAPVTLDRQASFLDRKRTEYQGLVSQYFNEPTKELHKDTYRQIHIDIPRMNPTIALFQDKNIQGTFIYYVSNMFERVLFIWSIRHPASGYVQGMNDLVTPFFVVYLSEFTDRNVEKDKFNILDVVPEIRLQQLEADSFWSLSKLLDFIQDNYIFAQPGIQRKVSDLEDLMKRINSDLHSHLLAHSVEYIQFAFRWMNNLLMRELPLRCVIRLWDTYHSESEGFSRLHTYVCAALLQHFAADLLRQRDFQGLMLFLQNMPTTKWGNDQIGLLLAEAYKLQYIFDDTFKRLENR